MGHFYRVPADNRGLNYDQFFKDGDSERKAFSEFDSNNTQLLTLEETKKVISELSYIKGRLSED